MDDDFYAPPAHKEGATVFAPSRQMALTGELMVPDHTAGDTTCTSGDPKCPAAWLKDAHPGQVLYSFTNESKDQVMDPEAAIAVRGVLSGFPAGTATHLDATQRIIPRGVAVRPTSSLNPRIGVVVRGTASVVVHYDVKVGDRLHAVFPRIPAGPDFGNFIAGAQITAQNKQVAFPLLKYSRNRSTLVPAALPTLHVYPEKYLVDEGDLLGELALVNALADAQVCTDGAVATLDAGAGAGNLVGLPPAAALKPADGLARALFELCVDMYQAGHVAGRVVGAAALAPNQVATAVRARFRGFRPVGGAPIQPACDRIKSIIKKASHALYAARRRTFIGRARRNAGAGDTCDVDVDCLGTVNDSIMD